MSHKKPGRRKGDEDKSRSDLLKELNAIREKEVELLGRISEIGLDDKEVKALHDEVKCLREELRNKDDELQVQKEELKVQTEELEAQLEELRCTNDELECNIQQRKQAEQKIEYLASFPELNINSVIEIYDTGTIKYANPAANRLFPDLQSRGTRHPMLDGIGSGIIKQDQKSPIVRDVLVNGIFYQQDIFYMPDSRTFRIYAIDITERKRAEEALRNAKDHLEAVVLERTAELQRTNRMLQDEIAERVEAEKAVSAERQRFNDVLETLPAYLVLLTPDYHVPFANRFFRERFGESHGRRCFEYLFGRTEPCENCETYKVLKTGAPHRWEWTGPDGRNYDIYDFPFKDTDGSPLIMEMGIDITERKQAEAALKNMNKTLERRVAERTAELQEKQEELEVQAEEMEAQTGELLANNDELENQVRERKRAEEELLEAKQQAELYLDLMGHDISNMHQIAMGQLELMQDIFNTDGKLEAEDKELIDASYESLERSAKLIDNVRKLQRIRQDDVKNKEISLDEVLADVIKQYNKLYPEKSIKINAGEGPHIVKANELLRDVFTNLIGNAFKHSNGSKVDISVKLEDVQDDGKKYYKVSIEDNGPGIPDDMKDKIFNRLQRGQTKVRGMGLGLYLVKSLMDSYNGKIRVEDRVPGDHTKGSRFVVYFPAEGKHVR